MGALFDSGIEVQCVSGEHIGAGRRWLGRGCSWGDYQPGVCMPLKALFLVVSKIQKGNRQFQYTNLKLLQLKNSNTVMKYYLCIGLNFELIFWSNEYDIFWYIISKLV